MVNVEPLLTSNSSNPSTDTKTTTFKNDNDFESLPSSASVWTHMTAGALAGITEHSVTYPFDCIKTRMQVLRPDPAAVYTGWAQALHRISTQEGVGRLWRGIGSVIIGAGPAHAIYFAAYEQAKRLLQSEKLYLAGWWNPIAIGLAGAIATASSDGFMTPFDVVKQRMQIYQSTHKSALACARSIWRTEGLVGFFISYPTTLISNVPFHMIQFPTYEFCRSILVRWINNNREYHRNHYNRESPLAHVIAGGIAGGTAAFFTTPIDVIKTTLQTRNLIVGNITGMRDAVALIYKEHGAKGFLRGAIPRTLTFIPGTALCWMVYEYFKAHLRGTNK